MGFIIIQVLSSCEKGKECGPVVGCVFDYIVSNSKLEFEDFDTTKLILSLPDIEDIFNENEKFIDEIPFKKYEYNLRSFIR
jgi:hypothetical protein